MLPSPRVLILSLLFLTSCATGPDYNTLSNYMVSNQCEDAAKFVSAQRSSYGLNGKLLHLFDSGMVDMLCGRYESSNKFFHEAEDLAERLWTKSLTKELASFVVNDYTRAYGGEDFEKAFINLFSAINYMMLGQTDESLVELRRLDANLSLLNQKYKKKNVYKEDAFGRYLSGMVYEASKEFDDAYIDYFNAYNIYRDYNRAYGTPTPKQLEDDLIRLSVKTGRENELPDSLKGKGNPGAKGAWRMGKVVAIKFNGKSPVKVEEKLIIPSPNGPIVLAFPRYVTSRPACRNASLFVQPSVGGPVQAGKFELAEDVNEIAVKNLKDRKARVIVKTIARAAVKQIAINTATDDDMVKTLFNIANSVIERADTRTWRTLPGELLVSRIHVRPGEYQVASQACGGSKRALGEVKIKAGETKFFIVNTVY